MPSLHDAFHLTFLQLFSFCFVLVWGWGLNKHMSYRCWASIATPHPTPPNYIVKFNSKLYQSLLRDLGRSPPNMETIILFPFPLQRWEGESLSKMWISICSIKGSMKHLSCVVCLSFVMQRHFWAESGMKLRSIKRSSPRVKTS